MRVAPLAAVLLLPFALACAPALAADAAEIAFWESVRDSKDATELRAYLERYPNGDFAALARRRLAALEAGARPSTPVAPAPPAAPRRAYVPPARNEIAWSLPKAGDTWTYRWREGKAKQEHTMVVTAATVTGGEIVDQATIDGGTPALESKHARGSYVFAQGASVYSPYLPGFVTLPARGSAGRLQFLDTACTGRQVCDGKARVLGKETVAVPAGTFVATRVEVEQSWAPAYVGAYAPRGGRRLTIWYAPEARRAVKYWSRPIVGGAPVETDFEIELVSFQVK